MAEEQTKHSLISPIEDAPRTVVSGLSSKLWQCTDDLQVRELRLAPSKNMDARLTGCLDRSASAPQIVPQSHTA